MFNYEISQASRGSSCPYARGLAGMKSFVAHVPFFRACASIIPVHRPGIAKSFDESLCCIQRDSFNLALKCFPRDTHMSTKAHLEVLKQRAALPGALKISASTVI